MRNDFAHPVYSMNLLWLILALSLSLAHTTAIADTYNFIVQPVLPQKRTLEIYQPLADYLSEKTGDQINLVAAGNFLVYWETMKKNNEYDIILDAAHFTDFRVQKLGYQVIAKLPDTVSYALVTGEDLLIIEPTELVGKKVATMASPSLGAIRLESMFPNLMRQPVIVETSDSMDAINKLKAGEVAGAIVPTPIVGQFPSLNTVITSEVAPHMGVSVSKKVKAETVAKLKQALVDATKTPEGQKMLGKINFPGFVPADNTTYAGRSKLLEGVWGYQ